MSNLVGHILTQAIGVAFGKRYLSSMANLHSKVLQNQLSPSNDTRQAAYAPLDVNRMSQSQTQL